MKNVALKVIIGYLIVVIIFALIGVGYNIGVDPSSFNANFLIK